MKNLFKIVSIVGLLLFSQLGYSDSITDVYVTGDTLTAGKLDNIKAAVNDNDTNVGTNATAISGNTASIGANATAISGNTASIGANATAISGNTAGIGTNATAISGNTAGIGTNATAISGNTAGIGAKQNIVTGTCPAGQSIRVINANGTVTCEVDTDTDTTYTAGSGLNLNGTTFSRSSPTCTRRQGADVIPSTFYNHATANCDPGETLMFGGYTYLNWNAANDQCHFIRNQPNAAGTDWEVTLAQPGDLPCSTHSFRAYAYCCTN